MTNEQKIKAYLAAGHWVKVTDSDGIDMQVTSYYYDMFCFHKSSGVCHSKLTFENCTVEPIPRKPPYKFGDKVVVLEIAREMDGYDDFSDTKKGTVGKVGTITGICPDGTYIINNEAFFPSWSIAPAFDDDKSTKIQELESQLAQIQKELELLKK